MNAMALDAESIFAQADLYTVRIDAAISTPFVEDTKGAAIGAGFIVDKARRWILTNAHVAGHSPSILEVEFRDGSRVEARKVYVDPYIDIAIIEVEQVSTGSLSADLGCDQAPGTGHPVGAYGHPWGFNFTGTQGVISGSTTLWGPRLLQTDTPINGGNSGGPLISMKSGYVIGINAAGLDNEEDQNTNFAVPIGQACSVLDMLRDGIDPSPPVLPFTFYDTLGEHDPLVVARTFVSDSNPKLRSGDEIVAVNGQAISDESQLHNGLRGVLQDVIFSVRRDGILIELRGRLEPWPHIVGRRGIYFAGLVLAERGFRDAASLDSGHDVMVHSIEPGSSASNASLYEYDYVARVNSEPVRGMDHLLAMLNSSDRSEQVQIDFLRINEWGENDQVYYSLRRNFKWEAPVLIGRWNEGQ